MIMAVVSIVFVGYVFVYYEILLEQFLPKTLDKLLLVSASIALMYLAMAFGIVSKLKHGTDYALLLAFAIFTIAMLY